MKHLYQMVLSILIFSGLQLSCKSPPKKIKFDSIKNQMNSLEENNTQADFPNEASVISFQENIYKPILKPYCSSCHAQAFASDLIEEAHTNFLKRVELSKFTNTSETHLVDKLRHNHNCWLDSAKKCAGAMEDAIDLWLADLQKLGFTPSAETFNIETAEIAFLDAKEVGISIDSNQYAWASVDQAILQAPFSKKSLANDGRITSYAVALGEPVLEGINALAVFADSSKSVSFAFDVKRPGSYSVWARISTPKSDMNGFFIGINDQTLEFNTPVTGEDSWKWVQLAETLEDDSTQPVLLEIDSPGKIQVPIIFRANGAKISYLVLNQKADEFDGEQFVAPYREIRLPLPLPDAFIIATVWELASNGIGVRDLRIESPRALHVKAIHPLINGVFHRSHGAYTQVDSVIGGSSDRDQQIIKTGGSLSTTLRADIKVDRLSFAFEILELSE